MRRAAVILTCLAIGAAVNLAAAWSLALWAPGPKAGRSRTVRLAPPAAWPPGIPAHWAPPDAAWVRTVFGLTSRSMFTGYRAGGYLNTAGRVIYLSGWPMRTLRWETRYDRQQFRERPRDTLAAYWLRDGIAPPEWVPGLDGAEWRRLPVRPVLPGLAVNTGAYAALAWAAIFGPGAARRQRRRRRGWCVACGYDLAGLPGCPECGSETGAAP